jgi:hypothetical protein
VLAAVLLLPLLSVPLFLLGSWIVDALDDDASDGRFALGLVLGVGGPALLALLTTHRRVGTPTAVTLGIVSGALSLGVLFFSLLVYCNGRDC